METEVKVGICLLVLFIALLLGNEHLSKDRKIETIDKTIQTEAGTKRFSAEFHGEFRGGYDNNVRQIFIITDIQTKTKYLTVTGCGTTELKTSIADGEGNLEAIED